MPLHSRKQAGVEREPEKSKHGHPADEDGRPLTDLYEMYVPRYLCIYVPTLKQGSSHLSPPTFLARHSLEMTHFRTSPGNLGIELGVELGIDFAATVTVDH